MKKRYTKEQIIGAIKWHKSGVEIDDISRKVNISNGTLYNRGSKYC